jgi:DNA-binding transcriptional ArsR family regulator
MKPIASAVDQLAFQLAIDQAESRLGGAERPAKALEGFSGAQRTPEAQQRPQEASQGRERLPNGVRSLRDHRTRQKAAEATEFAKLARKLGMDPAMAQELAAAYLADTRNAWTFVMLSPAQNDAVVEWLSDQSKRPQAAVRLWSHLFTCMRMDTGEILKSREELAERLGVQPRHVSSLMTELASINAVRREKRGREVRYFMNSTIATHLPNTDARAKAREADGPLLVVMQGGRTE